jgi:pyridoxine kinase
MTNKTQNISNILSFQSHTSFGFVGNKAIYYPLSNLGFNVSVVNTVYFSNHTGYKEGHKGKIIDSILNKDIFYGLENIGYDQKCDAIISGYIGSKENLDLINEIVNSWREKNKNLIYLCDPVMGGLNKCYVSLDVVEHFRNLLLNKILSPDIITPNAFEVEIITGIKVLSLDDISRVCDFFISKQIESCSLVIKGLRNLKEFPDKICIFIKTKDKKFLFACEEYKFDLFSKISGSGDLFSGLFLGFFMKTKHDLKLSCFNTIFALMNVIKNSSSELNVISFEYSKNFSDSLDFFNFNGIECIEF